MASAEIEILQRRVKALEARVLELETSSADDVETIDSGFFLPTSDDNEPEEPTFA